MANVNDAGDITGKHARRLEQVKTADINEQDHKAILEFHESRRTNGIKRNTLTTDLSALRNASERADVPLTVMTKDDLDGLLTLLTAPKEDGGYGLHPNKGGMYNYTRALRVFFRWLDERDVYDSFPFWDGIETPDQSVERQSEDERLTPSDVETLKEAAGRGRNTQRDRALIAFLADGQRITLTAQLRVGDIHAHGEDPYWTPNEEAEEGHKDIDSRKRTFLWSLAEVRSWLSHGHPDPKNPDAPLWPVQHYDPDNPQVGALSPDAVRGMLERAADRAGIDKPVNPHNFRHAAMTRLSNDEGLTPQQIQHIAGWADTRMLEVYDETTDRERNDSIRGALGMPTSTEDEQTTPEPTPCNNCREMITNERFCPNCGAAQEISTRLAKQNAKTDVRDGLAEDAADQNRVEARAALLDALEDPDAVDQIAEALARQND